MKKHDILTIYCICILSLYSGFASAACSDSSLIECSNGECVTNIILCPRPASFSCSSLVNLPFQCSDGNCVASFHECTINVSCQVSCWDGTCASNVFLCPIVPACPALQRRCQDGTCATNCRINQVCTPQQTCSDGSCPFNGNCSLSGGCPVSTPFLCPNGICVASTSACKKNCKNNEYACYDGSCEAYVENCATPPRLKYPIPFSQTLEPALYTNVDRTISVLTPTSSSSEEIAQVLIPDRVLKNQVLGLGVRSVSDSEILGISGADVWGESASYTAAILSSVIAFEMKNRTSYDLLLPITITFRNTLPPNTNVSDLCLAYVDTASKSWKCESQIEINANGDQLTATTTNFGPRFKSFAVLTRDAYDPGSHTFPKLGLNEMFPVYIIIGIVGLYAAALVITCKRATKKRRRRRRRGQPIPLRELMPDTVPIDGEERNSTRDNNAAILERFERERTATTDDSSSFDPPNNGIPTVSTFFRQNHTFVAWVFSKSDRLTLIDWLTVLLTEMLMHLMVATIISENKTYTSSARKKATPAVLAYEIDAENACVNAAIAACVVFCATMFVGLVYRYAPRQRGSRKFIAYFYAVALCLACITATIFYSNEFDKLERETWMVVFGVSIGMESIILQTTKITISYLVMSCRKLK